MYRIILKYNSKEEIVFLLSVNRRLSQLNFYTLNSVSNLNSLSETIFGLFSDC